MHSRIHFKIQINSVVTTVEHSPPQEMATLWNKRKLAAASMEKQEHPRNSQSQNTYVLGITEEYITHVSEELEGRFIKKLSQEFSRTEYQILGALSKLDEFLLNPQVRTLPGTVPGTSRNNDLESRESTVVRSQSDPHPEVEFSASQIINSVDSDPQDTSHNHQSLIQEALNAI